MAGNATLLGCLNGPCIVLHPMRAFGVHAKCIPTAHWLQCDVCCIGGICVCVYVCCCCCWPPGDAATHGVQQCCCQCCYGQALAATGCVLQQVVGGTGGGRISHHSRHQAGDCINLWRMVVRRKGWEGLNGRRGCGDCQEKAWHAAICVQACDGHFCCCACCSRVLWPCLRRHTWCGLPSLPAPFLKRSATAALSCSGLAGSAC